MALLFPLQNHVELDSVVCLSITRCRVLITCFDCVPETFRASKFANLVGIMLQCCARVNAKGHVVQTTISKRLMIFRGLMWCGRNGI